MKQNISYSDMQDIFYLNKLGNVLESKQLSGGEFNSVYAVTTNIGKYVIKIAPSNNEFLLTYEKNITCSERFALNMLCNNSYAKIPKVIAYSFDSGNSCNYLIIEFVEGRMLLNQKVSKDEYNDIMFNLGKAIAEFHNVKYEAGFGYLQYGLKKTWKSAYSDMIEKVIFDAQRVNCKIPYLSEIRNAVSKCQCVLDEVNTPAILHFDLWKGNIFVKDGKLSSIIDFERTMLGDLLGDFIHLDYITPFDVTKNKYLIDGYNSIADNKLSFNKNELIRLYLMRIYLGLVACVEPYYRFSKLNIMFYGRKIYSKRFMRVTLNELNKLTTTDF